MSRERSDSGAEDETGPGQLATTAGSANWACCPALVYNGWKALPKFRPLKARGTREINGEKASPA